MPTATLQINGDTSGLSRALGDVRAQAKATQKAIDDAFKGAGKAAEGSMDRTSRASARLAAQQQREAKQKEQADRKAYSEAERAAQRTVTSYVRAEEQKRRAARASAQVREKAEKEASAIAAAEARKRGLTAEQEARVRQTALEKLTKTYENAERRQTAIARREQREREHFERRRDSATERETSRIAGGIGQAATTGATAAAQAHAQIQDARQSRAQSTRVLDQAVRNAGGSEEDVVATRARVRQFVEQTGMTHESVAQALSTGQARGSSLEAQGGESRMSAVNRALELVRDANAEAADPGQYLAAQGRLRASGLSGDALKTAMRFSLSAAQAGQVEVDQLLQQGLPGATRLMDSRVGAMSRNEGETDAAFEARKQRVRLSAYRESVATQEVLAASGGNAGHTSNTLASLQSFMNTPRRQEQALTNIRAAEAQVNTATPEGRAHAARLRSLYEGDNAIFERDPTRTGNAMRLREGVSPVELATRVAQAQGGNAQAGANIFAGGGQGNAQAFLSNMRNLMGVLGGERGQRIQTMMQGAGVTDAQINTHRAGVENDPLAVLTRAQEKGANELTNNTNALVQLSNRIATFNAANPLASTGMVALGGLATSVLGAKGIGAAGGALLSTGGVINNARAAITGRGLNGEELGVGERLARSSAASLGVLGGLPGMALNGLTAARDVGKYAATSQGQDAILSLPERFMRALASTPITATVAPVDAAQAASRAPAPGR